MSLFSRLTEGVPGLLQLGWFMTSSCSCSPRPAQLGVRCGLPVSRNLTGNPTSVKGWREREQGVDGERTKWERDGVEEEGEMRKARQIFCRKKGMRWSRWECKLASGRNSEPRKKDLAAQKWQSVRVNSHKACEAETSNPDTEKKRVACGSRQLIWMQRLSSALISAGVEKAKCLYYFISQLAARRLLSLCAYWPRVCGCSFIVWGALYKRSITGEWLDYGVINALY